VREVGRWSAELVFWLLICHKRAFEGRSRSFWHSREGCGIMAMFRRIHHVDAWTCNACRWTGALQRMWWSPLVLLQDCSACRNTAWPVDAAEVLRQRCVRVHTSSAPSPPPPQTATSSKTGAASDAGVCPKQCVEGTHCESTAYSLFTDTYSGLPARVSV
jgi:hypothetical protein